MSNESPDNRTDDTDWEAIARYLAGESSPEESAEVERWLSEDVERREEMTALSALADRARITPPAGLDVEGALARVRSRLEEPAILSLDERREAAEAKRRRRPVWTFAGVRAAAAILVLVGASLLFRALFLADFGEEPAAAAARYATATGERHELVLGDGTRALLGPQSELVHDAGYGVDHHTVELSGEGFFDVPAASAGRFTVRVGQAVVRDLGTAFSVRGSTPGIVEVVVTEGSVAFVRDAVGDGDPSVVLQAGDLGEMDASGAITVQRGTASEADIAWTRGELVFREAAMARVAEDLRRWYGVELIVRDAQLATRRLTATFSDEPPAEVAHIIGLALGADAELVGDTLVLRVERGVR